MDTVFENPLIKKQEAVEEQIHGEKQTVKKIQEDIAKTQVKMEVEQTKKFEDLIDQSSTVLLRIRSVFPFDFFPDILTVEQTKVNVVSKIFFWSNEFHSFPISEIQDVIVSTNIFFASIRIVAQGFLGGVTHPFTTNFLWKKDAIKARRIIMGLKVCKKESIDLGKIKTNHFIEKLEEIGRINEAREV